ncbi:hypothetical protein GT037_010963 [Alternaria burnsii]|uniref:Extracellular membrane protein CFEM domain-containing protein n=5 Tax=Alternaria sect. Alternaria TaxID=2499237 RepID=A0A4Q4NNN2_ALTAL|nr:hypothetical protein AA0111_g2805 [Alternaria arborescens]XP_038781381.1 uncharacterized protein GT037_010963 [Alternaria burnsii]XP_051583409.1 uncharacterized protein J4E82_010602 [Alternaria postmessia]KAB2108692.1 hypothetical protein AG0111_0g2631 [Alternaria gaisen]KAH6857651.1 hypothetical protein B0T12DRAFT_483029 [Alternaria alternata]RII20005.1 hypothetical protein CUC08_Gglean001404 [Alternaria sp. MG1]RYN58947.1 hypothetical protein AA0114_g1776 [Alternaria tenuissima]KAF76709
MVRILSLATLLMASAITTQAAQWCQCLFQDDSHCCVYSDAKIGNLDCQRWCTNAHRADGATNPNNPLEAGTACNAGGKYKTVSGWNAQFRTPCYKQ